MRTVFIFLLLSLITGCRNSISQSDVPEFLQKHELVQEKEVNSIHYKVSVISNRLIANQIIGNIQYTPKIEDSIRNSIDQNLYLMAEISKNGGDILAQSAGTNNYRKIIDELEFGIGDRIKLTTEKGDTLPLFDYSFPRTYGLSNASKIIFVFAKPELKNSNYTELHIVDFGMGTGEVKFLFKNDNITKFLTKKVLKKDTN